jgi:hypothetical protein
VVGAVCCRVDLAEEGMKQLYIMYHIHIGVPSFIYLLHNSGHLEH